MSRASAIAARKKGDHYQALFFWRRATDVFHPGTHVVRVGFERADAGSFDDVFVEYDQIQNYAGHRYQIDLYQIKYHVRDATGYGWEDLTKPAFINSDKDSLLQRLHVVQQRHAPEGDGCRCILYSPQAPIPGDQIRRALTSDDGQIEWAKLLRATRKAWSVHLGLEDHDSLEQVLRPLRLHQGRRLQDLRDELREALRTAGIHDDVDALLSLYDALLNEDRCSFDATELKDRLREAGLWRGGPVANGHSRRVAVRSRMRGAEDLHLEVDDHLCLCDCFDDREAREPGAWHSVVWPKVVDWLRPERGDALTLHLGALHTSLAIGLGYRLDTRSGVHVTLVQSGTQGDQQWPPTPAPVDEADELSVWEFAEVPVGNGGPETALVVSVTRDIANDVRAYVQEQLPSVGKVVCARVPEPGTSTVRGPEHGQLLVERLVHHLQQARPPAERRHVMHLFAAAPNAVLFRLGQHLRGVGPTQCYEFGFDTTYTYSPSLRFPPSVEVGLAGQGG